MSEQILLTINEAERTVESSKKLILGVEHDHQAERVYFSIPKTIFMDENVDLMGNDISIYVLYKNAANSTYRQECTSTRAVDGDNIKFSWLLSSYVLDKRGNVSFSVWVQKTTTGTDSETGAEVVVETNDWHTTPYVGIVLPGLEFEDEDVEVITNDSLSIKALLEQFDDAQGMTDTEVAEYVTGVLTPINESIATLQSNYSTLGQTVQNQGTAISSMGDQVTANKNNITTLQATLANKIDKSSVKNTVNNSVNEIPNSKAVMDYVGIQLKLTENTTWKGIEIKNPYFLDDENDEELNTLEYIDTGYYIAKIRLDSMGTNDDDMEELGDEYVLYLTGFIKKERADSRLTAHDVFGKGTIISLELHQLLNNSSNRLHKYQPDLKLYEPSNGQDEILYKNTSAFHGVIEGIYKVTI